MKAYYIIMSYYRTIKMCFHFRMYHYETESRREATEDMNLVKPDIQGVIR